MTLDAMQNLAVYQSINRWIVNVIEFLKKNPLAGLAPGKYLISGDDCFLLVFKYTTKTPIEAVWEAHKKYLDIHTMIVGQEMCCCQSLEHGSSVKEYDLENDYELFEATGPCFLLEKHLFVMFHPEDLHKTGLNPCGEPIGVSKAVFKLRI